MVDMVSILKENGQVTEQTLDILVLYADRQVGHSAATRGTLARHNILSLIHI